MGDGVQWYADAMNGNDLYDGTSATFVSGTTGPCKTLKRAMELVGEYDTLWLLPGDYNEGELPYFDEKPSIKMTYATTNRCHITKAGLKIKSRDGKAVTFVTGAPDPSLETGAKFENLYGDVRCFLIANTATNVVLEGLTLRKGYAPYKQIADYYRGGGVNDRSDSCWVIDCLVTSCLNRASGGVCRFNASAVVAGNGLLGCVMQVNCVDATRTSRRKKDLATFSDATRTSRPHIGTISRNRVTHY